MADKKRLADVNALLEEINRTIKIMEKQSNRPSIRNVIMCVKNAPTVDAVEVVHGRWLPVKYNEYYSGGQHRTVWHLKCSSCNHIAYKQPYGLNYCPNCGAKMDGDGNG